MIAKLSEFQYSNSITIYSVLNQSPFFSTLLCSPTLKLSFYEKRKKAFGGNAELNIVSKFHQILNQIVAVRDLNKSETGFPKDSCMIDVYELSLLMSSDYITYFFLGFLLSLWFKVREPDFKLAPSCHSALKPHV